MLHTLHELSEFASVSQTHSIHFDSMTHTLHELNELDSLSQTHTIYFDTSIRGETYEDGRSCIRGMVSDSEF